MKGQKLFGRFVGGLTSVILFTILSTRAEAVSITYNLDCPFPPCTAGSAVYGTLTLADNGNNVDIFVDLTGTANKVHKIFLNYNNSSFSNTSAFMIGLNAIGVAEDAQQADGYSAGKFDLEIFPSGTLGTTDTYSGTMSLALVDLNVADFTFKDTNNLLFAAVHIGNCGPEEPNMCLPGQEGGNSIWVGASTPVPEPATLLLLGSGLAGMGFFGRKRLTKRDQG